MARLLLASAAAVVLLALASGAASEAPAPAPTADCTTAFGGLTGCLSYVMDGSAQDKPTKECCAGVKGALKSPATVACLCAALGQNAATVNVTRAAMLPAACGENPAALSKCNIKVPGTPTQGPAPGSSSPAANSPGASKSAAARSPVSAFTVVAALAAPLLSFYYL